MVFYRAEDKSLYQGVLGIKQRDVNNGCTRSINIKHGPLFHQGHV